MNSFEIAGGKAIGTSNNITRGKRYFKQIILLYEHL